jgi:hypothetical protein
MNTTLTIPNGVAEIQEVNGVKYLVARLDTVRTCSDFISELKAGNPVIVPFSKRAHLTGLLKKEKVFTRQKTVIAGQWVTFLPCSEREFKS